MNKEPPTLAEFMSTLPVTLTWRARCPPIFVPRISTPPNAPPLFATNEPSMLAETTLRVPVTTEPDSDTTDFA